METVKLPSGVSIPKMSPEEADRRSYLTKEMLDMMHLSPVGQPAACSGEGDDLTFYYDPARVTEAAPELWYKPMMDEHEPVDVIELDSGAEVEKLSTKRAAAMGFYTRERLDQMNYDVVEEPVAYNLRSDGTMIYFYDKRTAVRRPLKCTVCGKDVRYKRKMCRACFERDLAIRRAEGDAHRDAKHRVARRQGRTALGMCQDKANEKETEQHFPRGLNDRGDGSGAQKPEALEIAAQNAGKTDEEQSGRDRHKAEVGIAARIGESDRPCQEQKQKGPHTSHQCQRYERHAENAADLPSPTLRARLGDQNRDRHGDPCR